MHSEHLDIIGLPRLTPMSSLLHLYSERQRDRETERQRDRETETQRRRNKETESCVCESQRVCVCDKEISEEAKTYLDLSIKERHSG